MYNTAPVKMKAIQNSSRIVFSALIIVSPSLRYEINNSSTMFIPVYPVMTTAATKAVLTTFSCSGSCNDKKILLKSKIMTFRLKTKRKIVTNPPKLQMTSEIIQRTKVLSDLLPCLSKNHRIEQFPKKKRLKSRKNV